jgi:ABC-2 type transport system ATP-binding protein
MQLVYPTSGTAELLGRPIGDLSAKRRIGFLPENPYFYDFLTGREILHFYARLSGVDGGSRGRRVGELLERVGLGHAADARLRTYSKGMLQRIGIAQALVHDPEVVFLDEPMSGLDPIGRKEIRDLIVQLHAEGKTIFMNTHILTDVEMLCDRVAIIVKGRIPYEGRIEDFLGGDDRRCDVTLSNLPAELAEVFERRYGAVISGRGENVEFRVAEKHAGDMLRAALDAGAEVRSLAPYRVSLESIFMTAVQEEARAEGNAAAATEEGS